MREKLFAAVIIGVMIISFADSSMARMNKMHVDFWTTNYTDPAEQQLNVWIELEDDKYKLGPDIVESITITAPDGSQFYMDDVGGWLPFDYAYFARFYADDFISGVIPSGVYQATVYPEAGKAIKELDNVQGVFLPTPTIIFPPDGTTGLSYNLTIIWNKVPGARHYQILLWNETLNEPVYWYWMRRAFTDFNTFKIPRGQLKQNCEYRIRIEARAYHQDLDKKFLSDWITFTTSW
jgi:hypothetical protein